MKCLMSQRREGPAGSNTLRKCVGREGDARFSLGVAVSPAKMHYARRNTRLTLCKCVLLPSKLSPQAFVLIDETEGRENAAVRVIYCSPCRSYPEKCMRIYQAGIFQDRRLPRS